MGFIAKSPVEMAELDTNPSKLLHGTRALFAKRDGWYDIDSNGNVKKLTGEADKEVDAFSDNPVANSAITRYVEEHFASKTSVTAFETGDRVAKRSECDKYGKAIHTTYATKEEVANSLFTTIECSDFHFLNAEEINQVKAIGIYRIKTQSASETAWLFVGYNNSSSMDCVQTLIHSDGKIYSRYDYFVGEDENGDIIMAWSEWKPISNGDGASIIVDTEANIFSTNPVANAAITSYVEGIHQALINGDEVVNKAYADATGNCIDTTYATKEELVVKKIQVGVFNTTLEHRTMALSDVTSSGIYMVEYTINEEVINDLNDILIVVRDKTNSNSTTIQFLYSVHDGIKYRWLWDEETLMWSSWLELYVVEQEFDPHSVYSQSGQAISAYLEEQIGDIETSLENIIAKYGLGGDGA